MKIGIIDADLIYKKTNFPNLALMKISSFCKQEGKEVSLLLDYSKIPEFDFLYLAKVFTDTEIPETVFSLSNIQFGGTGFGEEIDKPLSYEMEHSLPDYTLYTDIFKGDKHDCSIGYTTRGCFRKCSFCVNKKYDKAFKASSLSEIIDPQKKYICLLDDNFLAYKGWRNILQELKTTNKRFVFKHGSFSFTGIGQDFCSNLMSQYGTDYGIKYIIYNDSLIGLTTGNGSKIRDFTSITTDKLIAKSQVQIFDTVFVLTRHIEE